MNAPLLTVRNFSCIENLTVRFERLTVFIGEQASGKSVTCKLYYFFTQVLMRVFAECAFSHEDFSAFRKRYEQEFRNIFPETTWIDDAFRITWENAALRLVVTHEGHDNQLSLDIATLEAIYSETLAMPQINLDGPSETIASTLRQVAEAALRRGYLSPKLDCPEVVYIPAGRSFFSSLQENVFTLLSSNIGIDYFLKEFGRRLENLRFAYRRGHFKLDATLCARVLHGEYADEGKEQWIMRDAHHRVRLSDASSGQQESLPLMLLFSSKMRDAKTDSEVVLIEEPEAHLYPSAQRAIVEAIGTMLSRDGKCAGFILTTHSPFILCCLNNLLMQKKLAVSDVAAYHLHDGTADDILNTEVGLIDAVRFDDVSIQIMNGE